MDRLTLTPEQIEAVEQICIDIFVDMTNARYSLTEALTACYLSGVAHIISTLKGGS